MRTIIKHLTISRARLLPAQAPAPPGPQCQQSSPCAELTSEFPLRRPSLLLLLGWPCIERYVPYVEWVRLYIQTKQLHFILHPISFKTNNSIIGILKPWTSGESIYKTSKRYNASKRAMCDGRIGLSPALLLFLWVCATEGKPSHTHRFDLFRFEPNRSLIVDRMYRHHTRRSRSRRPSTSTCTRSSITGAQGG